jgi:Family of unknown function (DUF6163)
MKILRGSARNEERADSGAAIRLGPAGRASETSPWGLALVVFMRLLAVLWVGQGLSQWAAILLPREPLFDQATEVWGAAVIFFAALDLVAAVGLWLATPWGGVIWLFCAVAQILAGLMIPGFFAGLWIGVTVVLICLYFALTWLAARRGDGA